MPLSIIFAEDDSYLPSLYNNYIMPISKKDFSTFEQADNDWMLQKEGVFKVNTMVLPKYLLESRDDILELMLQLLENKSYILTKSNEYYIPDRNAYKKFNFDHENLVYGFDMEKQQFNIASYKSDGYYGGSLISFDEYFDALKYNEYTVLHLISLAKHPIISRNSILKNAAHILAIIYPAATENMI